MNHVTVFTAEALAATRAPTQPHQQGASRTTGIEANAGPTHAQDRLDKRFREALGPCDPVAIVFTGNNAAGYVATSGYIQGYAIDLSGAIGYEG